jgi:mannosyltransferase
MKRKGRRYFVLSLILLLGFALRVIMINIRPIWYDDAFSIFLARLDLGAMAFGTAADTMPPLYYALMHYWLGLFGDSPFALRMLSVTISLSLIPLTFACAARAFGGSAGNWASLFTAVAPFQIYHAQELRMYALLAGGLLLFVYAMIRIVTLEDGRRRVWAPYLLVALASALSLYVHNLAVVTLVAGNLYLAVRRAWVVELKLIAAQCAGAIVFVPWLIYVPGQVAKIQRAFWTLPPGPIDIVQMLLLFTTYVPLPNILLACALFVTIALFAFTAFKVARLIRQNPPPLLTLLVVFILIPPAVLFVLSYIFQPVFVPRGVIASELVYLMLLGLLTASLPRRGRIAVGVLAGVIALAALPFLYSSWGEWRRAPFIQADQFLRVNGQPNDLILHDNKLSFFPMHFYDGDLPQEFLPDLSGSANDTLAFQSQEAMQLFPVGWDAARAHTRTWFVIFQTALDQAAQEGHPHGNLAHLDGSMHRTSVTSFGDLRIFLYETH